MFDACSYYNKDDQPNDNLKYRHDTAAMATRSDGIIPDNSSLFNQVRIARNPRALLINTHLALPSRRVTTTGVDQEKPGLVVTGDPGSDQE